MRHTPPVPQAIRITCAPASRGLPPAGGVRRRDLGETDIWARRTGQAVRLVSANDHVHSRTSAHYDGLAVDLHSSANAALAKVLRTAGYAVLWNVRGHFSHVHVQVAAPVVGPAASAP